MNTSEDLKKIVNDTYTVIANQSKEENENSCCGIGGCATVDYAVFAENYQSLKGYNEDADLGLGCGIPTEFANIKEGDTVVDLGSGAGNDCFVARAIAGEKGKVIGIDMTEAMINKARENAEKLGFNNVEFRLGDIENMPMAANKADVVVSNCVLNLVPDKIKAFSEIYRILKPGGHISISDVVLQGSLPEPVLKSMEMYAGCVSGALQKDNYLNIIYQTGFENIKVQKEKVIQVPEEILSQYLSQDKIREYRESGKGIYSITLYAEKSQAEKCCGTDCCTN